MPSPSRSLELVQQGVDAEFARNIPQAREFYSAAWQAAEDDFQACVAAHYVAHLSSSPVDKHRWNLEALARAERVRDGRVQGFYPSLFVNLGRSYELLGDHQNAAVYYARAAALGLVHDPGAGGGHEEE
ncbi:MAG: hypothetical protein HY904_07485 [Deltaproteobacteria bacterium]|nr:hypothetical protein [Deltaproteobacteria bacterium]